MLVGFTSSNEAALTTPSPTLNPGLKRWDGDAKVRSATAGDWRADLQTMVDAQRKHKTVLVVKGRDATSVISDDLFKAFNLKT